MMIALAMMVAMMAVTMAMMIMMAMVAIMVPLTRFGHHLLHHFFPAVDISKLEHLYPALQVAFVFEL